MFQDKTIVCRDCEEPFAFTAGEQGFYVERGLLNEPQRCYSCRERRRRERIATARLETTVVCDDCATTTTVPFVPRQGRPVYCASCFEKARAGVLVQSAR